MPTTPSRVVLTNTSVDVLNAIRNSASNNYQDYVPIATPDANVIKHIGNIIMDYPAIQNEFVHALINRIGMVLVTSKLYSNPWAMFKRGILEFGETVEEVFVDIVNPAPFNPGVAETEVFKRELPDVRSAFHPLNYQKFYKVTIENDTLRKAFLTMDGVTDLIGRIVNSMYTSANYDEFLVMKYLIARSIINGNMVAVNTTAVSADNAKDIVTSIIETSNNFTFMSEKYNRAGVANYSDKNEQYLITSAKFNSIMNVDVLAAAFNMNKAEFAGHQVMVDSFGNLDNTRLAELFADDADYTEIDSTTLTALDGIPAVIVDKDWFMIFDNMLKFTEQYNAQGLYWNYWLHAWKTFSCSPFANAAVFLPATPTVTSVTVSPESVSIAQGGAAKAEAAVVVTNFAPQDVVWTSSRDDVHVNGSGYITVDDDASTSGTVTITATSVFDSSKKDTCTVTVTAAD